MKNYLFIALVILVLNINPVFAEKIPVRITPVNEISTHLDQTEVGDWIVFKTTEDVFVDDNIFIKKGAKVVGIVDFVHPNGWTGDAADIKIKEFRTLDVNNKKIEINYPLNINGNDYLKKRVKDHIYFICSIITRGHEIYIEPNSKTYNLFIER